MKPTIYLGSGNSRSIRSVPNLAALAPTYEKFIELLSSQDGVRVDIGPLNDAGLKQRGTDLSPENLISDDTSEMFGGAETPNEAFAILGKYNQYWWRYKRPIVSVGEAEFAQIVYSTQTVQYSDGYAFDFIRGHKKEPHVILKEPVQSVSLRYSADKEEADSLLKGKYVLGANSEIWHVIGDEPSYTGSSRLYMQSEKISMQLPDGWEYVQSNDRHAYPDNVETGDIQYQFLGRPFDNAVTPYSADLKIEIGYYFGTGVCGANNKNSLTFSFTPVMVFIAGAGGDWHSQGLPYIWGKSSFPSWITDGSWAVCSVAVDDKTMSWYHTTAASSGGITYQLNTAGGKYLYIAIG